jgi:hypothetical protein
LKIAVFPCKADPLHVGHLIQIKRLLKEYPRVIVDIYVYEGRCMSFCEVVDILEELFAERSRGLIFEKHKKSYSESLPGYSKEDYIFVTGNKKVVDNLKGEFQVKKIDRFKHYRAREIKKEIKNETTNRI